MDSHIVTQRLTGCILGGILWGIRTWREKKMSFEATTYKDKSTVSVSAISSHLLSVFNYVAVCVDQQPTFHPTTS